MYQIVYLATPKVFPVSLYVYFGFQPNDVHPHRHQIFLLT